MELETFIEASHINNKDTGEKVFDRCYILRFLNRFFSVSVQQLEA